MSRKRQKSSSRLAPKLEQPSVHEQSAIAQAVKRVDARPVRFRTRIDTSSVTGTAAIGSSHSDEAGWASQFLDAFGTSGSAFATSELNKLVSASRTDNSKCDSTRLNALIAIVDGVKPENEVQALLASQIAVTHGLVMECLLRTQRADMLPQFEASGRLAVKLMRALAGHVETLNKLQRGGEQTVRVEHVTVHAGGQAVVGNVTTGGRESGKNDHQPHAPGISGPAEAPIDTAMRSKDAEREPVPRAGGERQKALPDARRRSR